MVHDLVCSIELRMQLGSYKSTEKTFELQLPKCIHNSMGYAID